MKKTFAALSAFALVAGLAACGGNDSSESSGSTDAAASGKITVEDAWVKATDTDMTAMFGTVENGTDEDRTIVSADSDVAGMVELHETVADGSGSTMMKEKKDGFPLPAGESKELEPGADHVMLMSLDKELAAGDTVTVTLTFDDDSTLDVEAPVKPFTGAKETYAPSEEASTHDGH
ncbi:MAG: copper chaperone PCu(A)C [Galactobacter sp.]